jgi:hypothetical protein
VSCLSYLRKDDDLYSGTFCELVDIVCVLRAFQKSSYHLVGANDFSQPAHFAGGLDIGLVEGAAD